MPAPPIFGRVLDYSGSHRVQVDVCDELAEIVGVIHDLGPISALQKGPEDPMPAVEALRKSVVYCPHRSRQRYLSHAYSEVVVVRHHAPSENLEIVPFLGCRE